MYLSSLTTEDTAKILLALVRVLAMVLTMPKLGSDAYFFLYRVLFSVVICIVVGPLMTSGELAEGADWLSLAIGEAGIGLSIGIATSVVVLGAFSAGQIVSQMLGFQIGSLQQGMSPDQASDFRKLFFVVALAFWFVAGCHRIAVEGLLESFHHFPVGQLHFSNQLVGLMSELVNSSLAVAIRFSLPIVLIGGCGFVVAACASRFIGSGQTASFGFSLNQTLALLLFPIMAIVLFHEISAGSQVQLQSLFDQWGAR